MKDVIKTNIALLIVTTIVQILAYVGILGFIAWVVIKVMQHFGII